jgi:hypothetical protein
VVFLYLILASIFIFMLFYPFRLKIEYRRSGKDDFLSLHLHYLFPFSYSLPLIKREGTDIKTKLDFPAYKKPLTEKITTKKLSEELKILETPLHHFLAALDVINMLAGSDPNDDKNRSLGSPTLHLFTGPFFFLRYIRVCEKLVWKSKIGSSDPAFAGILTGLAWSVKSTLYSVLTRKIRFLAPPVFNVETDFDHPSFETSFSCIFRFTLGEIMHVIVKDKFKEWQKGVHTFGYRRNSSH